MSPRENFAARRACDRCWSLKTQCDSQSPCSRCQRLQLPCLTERPLKTKGRPRKASSRIQVDHQSSPDADASLQEDNASQSMSNTSPASTTLSQGLRELPISHRFIDDLLQQFLSCSRKLGIFGTLPASACLAAETPTDSSLGQPLSPELRCSLLAISLEIFHYRVPETVVEPRKMSHDLLRMSVPALIPNIAWESHQLQVGNILFLVLFSHTWSLSVEFANTALRWHSLACTLYENCANYTAPNHGSDELKHRTEMALYIQDVTLTLLHNRTKHSCHFQIETKSQVTDNAWNARGPVLSNLSHCPPLDGDSYFGLMHPLANCMRAINEAPLLGSREWVEARNGLFTYFFRFPPTLLRFDDLVYPYQAEAMIWMHGLFVILYGTRDLVELFMNPVYSEVKRFSYLLEHSLLLGDILPTFLSLDPYLDSLSPATVFFILHSAVIHALALRQFVSTDSSSGAFLDTGAPGKLARSSDYHCDMLSAMRLHCKRYDIPLIEEVQSLLSYYLTRATFRAPSDTAISAQILMRYRWCREGTGIIPLPRGYADAQWDYPIHPKENVWEGQLGDGPVLQPMIVKLCNPDTRICRNGYFDLSILIR